MAFRDAVVEIVAEMTAEAGFEDVDEISRCIVNTIDVIHSYTEEGIRLYPELLITTNLSGLITSLPTAHYFAVGVAWPIAEGLAQAVKRCAPLARDGWVIAAQLSQHELEYGILSVESSELSPSLYSHAVGEYALPELAIPALYLRGLGGQRVELKTRQRRETITVSLREAQPDDREITALALVATSDVAEVSRDTMRHFFAKLFGDAIRHTHGCLVGVVRDRKGSVNAFKRAYADGAYLREPMDFVEVVAASEELGTRAASMAVRNYSAALRGMLSHDGITMLSTKGRVIGVGYHRGSSDY